MWEHLANTRESISPTAVRGLSLIEVDASLPQEVMYNMSRTSPGILGRTERAFDVVGKRLDKYRRDLMINKIDRIVNERNLVYRPMYLPLGSSELRNAIFDSEDYKRMSTSWSLDGDIIEKLIKAGKFLIEKALQENVTYCSKTRLKEFHGWFTHNPIECRAHSIQMPNTLG